MKSVTSHTKSRCKVRRKVHGEGPWYCFPINRKRTLSGFKHHNYPNAEPSPILPLCELRFVQGAELRRRVRQDGRKRIRRIHEFEIIKCCPNSRWRKCSREIKGRSWVYMKSRLVESQVPDRTPNLIVYRNPAIILVQGRSCE